MPINEELLKQNLKIVDWVQNKIEFCNSQITMWKSRLKYSYKYSDKEYVNSQIGKYVIEKENLDYFLYLLNKDYASLLSSVNEYETKQKQLKIKMEG